MIPLLEWVARLLAQLKPTPSWSDRRLARRCLAGHEDAWQALVEKYQRLVYALALEHGFPGDEAAEIFQQVWLEVLRHLETHAGERSIRRWLVRTTRDVCVERHRRLGPAAGAEQVPHVRPRRIAELERQQSLRESLDRLCPRCRQLIQLLFYSEPALSTHEIAGRLSVSPRTFAQRQRRCLERLHRMLGGSTV